MIARFLLGLAASTAATAQPMPGNMPPGGGRMPPMASFISPAGKPYRSPRSAPYAIVDWFKAIDRGAKGYVTAADFEAEATGFFVELDINHDGEIAPDEMDRYEHEIAPEVQAGMGMGPMGGMGGMGGMPRGGPPGGGMGGPPGGMGGGPPAGMMKRMAEMPKGAAMFALTGVPQPVIAADSNFNRGVTLAELRAAVRQRFNLLDTKSAGRLTLADLPQTPIEKMMKLKR